MWYDRASPVPPLVTIIHVTKIYLTECKMINIANL